MISPLVERWRVRAAERRLLAREAEIEAAWQRNRPAHATIGDRIDFKAALREEIGA